jgi:hypothetical protein
MIATLETHGWYLADPREIAEKHPDTWKLIPEEYIHQLVRGQLVKFVFEFQDGGERMWVALDKIDTEIWEGILVDMPMDEQGSVLLPIGTRIFFDPAYIIDFRDSIFTLEEIANFVEE